MIIKRNTIEQKAAFGDETKNACRKHAGRLKTASFPVVLGDFGRTSCVKLFGKMSLGWHELAGGRGWEED